LKRVIGNDGSHLEICPAVLLDHTRHKVKHADYPGILPYSTSRSMLNHELEPEDRSVRGSLVVGLSKADMSCLDVFEGDEYLRKTVQVHPLGIIVPLAAYEVPKHWVPGSAGHGKPDLTPSTPDPLPPNPSETLNPPIECETYVWASYPEELAKEPWSFQEFIRLNGWKWVPGEGGGDHEDYLEVDRRREMGGIIARGSPWE